jgi:hypothetical protein
MEELILCADSVRFEQNHSNLTIAIKVKIGERRFMKTVMFSELKYLDNICKQLKYELTRLADVK